MSSNGTLDKVIAITGASSGIGRAVAEMAAADGAAVVLSARRSALLTDLTGAIKASGGRALAVPADVTSANDMRDLVTKSVEAFGRLDVMICNAGIGFHDTFTNTPVDAMRRLVDVNVLGTLYAAHAAMLQFRAQNSGHVIAISSVAGRRGIPGSALYSATKAAQIGFIESLRADVFGTPIHASIVYPVSTKTEFRDAIQRDFGIAVRARGPEQSAELVARTIVDCIRTPRAEVYPYWPAKLLAALSVIAPTSADRLVQRFVRHADRSSNDEGSAQ